MKYVILQNIKTGERFFCMYSPGDNPEFSATGERWYKIIGYGMTIAECQIKLYGRSFTDRKD